MLQLQHWQQARFKPDLRLEWITSPDVSCMNRLILKTVTNRHPCFGKDARVDQSRRVSAPRLMHTKAPIEFDDARRLQLILQDCISRPFLSLFLLHFNHCSIAVSWAQYVVRIRSPVDLCWTCRGRLWDFAGIHTLQCHDKTGQWHWGPSGHWFKP